MRHTERMALLGGLTVAIALNACSQPAPSIPQSVAPLPVLPTNLATGSHSRAQGTIALTVRWPERPRSAQVLPVRTNSLVIQVRDSEDHVQIAQTITRPQDGSTEMSANLEVAANQPYRVHVAAFQEQAPGYDSIPIAEGSTDPVTVVPNMETSIRVALVPTGGPLITSIPTSGGPLSYATIQGQRFDGWGGPIKVTFGGVDSPVVVGSSTLLQALIPSDALDGPITVSCDGVTATSPNTFRIIRSLSLSPASGSIPSGTPVEFTVTARDATGAVIPSPVVSWSFEQDGPVRISHSDAVSTLDEGVFTPGATGSFEIRVFTGSIWATASVTVH